MTIRLILSLAALLITPTGFVRAGDVDARIEAFEAGLQPAVAIESEPEIRWTLTERMEHWKVPGMSIAVIRNGQLAWAKGYGLKQAGTDDAVDPETVFSVGSVSKVGTAAITLRLVDAGKLDLNRDVNEYLTRWQVPENEFTENRRVTLRGILSHSAGLTVHGFPDFQPGQQLPTVVETLNGTKPARNRPVRVFTEPGSKFKYSGGGVTIEQLVIEEATGLTFPEAAKQHLFTPLAMARSTYENPLPAEHGNVAKAHNSKGKPAALPRGWEAMPEMGASGLWTTPSDYARLVIALIESYRGSEGSFLSTAVARDMLTEVGRSPYGLGPRLNGRGATRRFSHGGSNNSYKAWMEGHPSTGNGMVIFTNGAGGGALLSEVRRAVAAAEGWGPAFTKTAPLARFELSAEELEAFEGTYRTNPAETVVNFRAASSATVYRVSYKDGHLRLATRFGSSGTPLIPVDASHFMFPTSADSSIEFVRGYGGAVESMIIRSGEYAFEAVKKK